MENWDILDSDRKHTGRTVQRGKPMKQDEYHLVVHVWIKNKKNQFLIQKRAPNKTFPNLWSITGGSAVSGDDSLTTALKETFEEIGATLDPKNGKIVYQHKRQLPNFPDFVDVWLFTQDFDLAQITFQPEEVSDAMWANKEEIKELMKNGKFANDIDYMNEFLEKHCLNHDSPDLKTT